MSCTHDAGLAGPLAGRLEKDHTAEVTRAHLSTDVAADLIADRAQKLTSCAAGRCVSHITDEQPRSRCATPLTGPHAC
eukprot:13486051-Alexandrium_andersonii.AAC.1